MGHHEIDRYCACGCWHEAEFEDGELCELSAHICDHHMNEVRGYLDALGIDKTPYGQYTLTFESRDDQGGLNASGA